jgi:hypothetical protein
MPAILGRGALRDDALLGREPGPTGRNARKDL